MFTIIPVGVYEVSKLTTDIFVVVINEVCLEQLSLLQHSVCPKEKGKFVPKLQSENCLIVRPKDSIRSGGILTVFCCVRNSIPIRVNC